MSMPKWLGRWCLSVAPAALIVAVVATARRPSSSLAATIPVAASGRGVLDGYVVAQPADCEGNLSFIALLDRPEIARGIRLRGVLIAGSAAQVRAAAAQPTIRRTGMPVMRLRSSTSRALATLGVRSTPYFVVFARSGGVRLAVHSPRTPQEYVRLARLLTALAAAQ